MIFIFKFMMFNIIKTKNRGIRVADDLPRLSDLRIQDE